jgi:excisionase family DNA binding protein
MSMKTSQMPADVDPTVTVVRGRILCQSITSSLEQNSAPTDDHPWTVREAAKFLGVSLQTVYLWVERKQIPHLRVMGRNIRFLKSDLEPFRASFKQEMENE